MTPLKEQQFLGVFADLFVKEGCPWGNLLVLVILIVLTLQIIIIWNPTLCCLPFLAVTRPIAWLLVTTTSTRARAPSRSSASARSSSTPTGTATTSLQGNAPGEGFAGGEAAQMEMFFFPRAPLVSLSWGVSAVQFASSPQLRHRPAPPVQLCHPEQLRAAGGAAPGGSHPGQQLPLLHHRLGTHPQ